MKQKILQMAEQYRFDKCIDDMESFHKEIQGNGKKTHDIENSVLIQVGICGNKTETRSSRRKDYTNSTQHKKDRFQQAF